MPLLKGLLAPLPFIVVAGVLLLAPAGILAGAWTWPRAWGFLAAFGLSSLAGSATLAVAAPASFKVRQQGLVAAKGKRQPLIDAVGSVFYALYTMAWFAFIPIDVFRLRLLPPPGAALSALGAAATIAGVAVAYAALAQNRFAAPTIHDQTSEGQRVIDTGLYALVRHPFYAGMLLVYGGAALWLGSYAALIGASGFLAMTLARIVIEEAYLRQTLPAYAGYARRVRGRLVPYLL
ncbi:isoprenylcysteine carboxylmethyltransferase family protein [Phenylobacterium sp.]|uniref:methyltransferase family protein n=1 Tax=Phenylobacterium sp. TaxID=1871053 RepID=UPI003565DF2F